MLYGKRSFYIVFTKNYDRNNDYRNRPFIPAKLPVRKWRYDEDLHCGGFPVFGPYALGKLYDVAARQIAKLGICWLAPMTHGEAVNSAQIEGSQSTIRDALLFEAGEGAAPEQRDDLREIDNYRRAIADAETTLREGRPFDLWMLRGLHAALLKGSVRGAGKNPGAFRSRQVWIGSPGAPAEHATYIPPPPEKVSELLENWLAYWRADEPSPLVQMAVLHGQFEVIHPFEDGNGRIGRLLLPLFLRDKKVLGCPAFYLSARLARRREEYYRALRGLNARPAKWREWISFFLQVCEEQAEENLAVCPEIVRLRTQLGQRAEELLHSRYARSFDGRDLYSSGFLSARLEVRRQPSERADFGKDGGETCRREYSRAKTRRPPRQARIVRFDAAAKNAGLTGRAGETGEVWSYRRKFV